MIGCGLHHILSFAWALVLVVPGAASAQSCAYKTIAGRPTTFSGEGVPLSQARFHSPSAIAIAPDGSMFIADTGNHRIRRVAPDGTIRTVAGNGRRGYAGDGGPALNADLNEPQGVAVAPGGEIFIADTGNHRVRKVKADGTIQTVAGNGRAGDRGDNVPGPRGLLNAPTQLALHSDGTLFILEKINHRVRRLATDGILTTAAGSVLDDGYSNVCSSTCASDTPAAKSQLGLPVSITLDREGASTSPTIPASSAWMRTAF